MGNDYSTTMGVSNTPGKALDSLISKIPHHEISFITHDTRPAYWPSNHHNRPENTTKEYYDTNVVLFDSSGNAKQAVIEKFRHKGVHLYRAYFGKFDFQEKIEYE